MSDSTTRHATGGLTLLYASGAAAVLGALYAIAVLANELFSLWTGPVGNISLSIGYMGAVEWSVLAVLFSVLAFLLYKKVTKAVGAEPAYLETTSYHFITNALVGVLAFAFVVFVGRLVSVLISSLVLIGANVDIGSMYLNQFLPELLVAGVVGFAGFSAYKIMKGTNLSFVMTLVVLSVAGAMLIATLITVPIKAHSGSSTTTIKSYDYSRFLEDLNN